MKVINMFAGPGAGKSTLAAGLFYEMKKRGFLVELVTEYAKEKVWENSIETMSDQLYMLSKQNRKLERLRGKVDYVITDSPLLLGGHYGKKYGLHPEIVVPLSRLIYETYDNLEFFIKRSKPFDPRGRLGSERNAIQDDKEILEVLKSPIIVEYNNESISYMMGVL